MTRVWITRWTDWISAAGNHRRAVEREEGPRGLDEIGHAGEGQGAHHEPKTRAGRPHSGRSQEILAEAGGRLNRRPRSGV